MKSVFLIFFLLIALPLETALLILAASKSGEYLGRYDPILGVPWTGFTFFAATVLFVSSCTLIFMKLKQLIKDLK